MKFLVTAIFMLCFPHFCPVISASSVPGFKLSAGQSRLTAELNFYSLNTFRLCGFFKISGDTKWGATSPSGKLLTASDSFLTITLEYSKNTFILSEGDIIVKYLKVIDYEKWFKLCLRKKDENSIVELEINDSKPKEHNEDQERITLRSSDFNPLDDLLNRRSEAEVYDDAVEVTYVVLEFGAFLSRIEFEVAGLVISSNATETSPKFSKSPCFTDYDLENFEGSDESGSFPKANVFHEDVDICRDMFVIMSLTNYMSYKEHAQKCRSFSGRMLTALELESFRGGLIKKETSGTGKQRTDNSDFGTWIEGGNEEADSLKFICSYAMNFTLNDNLDNNKPCIIETNYNLCIVPAYTFYKFYGPLHKYDRNYFIKQAEEGVSFVLEGEESSFIEKRNNVWILGSRVHQEKSELAGKDVPFNRNKWLSKTSDKTHILTFTHCDVSQFACSNGECMSKETRCNGVEECQDGSDEFKCQLIKKKRGYVPSLVPPPRTNESLFQISYVLTVYNVADITNEDGKALIDVFLGLVWHDPRLVFWNPIQWAKFDCSEIWTPELTMADGFPSGFQVSFNAYRSACQVYEVNERKVSFEDPYMGTYVSPEEMKISLMFSGLVTVPCRFHLRRYPFGTQRCNISIWPDNALLTSLYEISVDNVEGVNNKTVSYEGRKTLGEYRFLEATHEVINYKKRIMLSIRLRSLSEFHMLNSYIPSLLIWIITYATLYFPVDNFNERVMVSLTALLVLAALFTQASDLSVITPYFKFLDIWYVTLIFLCFGVVIFNTFIHKVRTKIDNESSKQNGGQKKTPEEDLTDSHIEDSRVRKLMIKNIVARAGFALLFLGFFVVYGLGAMEVI